MTGKRPGSKGRTLYLFPDTNVFIQCRGLNEVDWSEVVDCEKIHIIACPPVQREMDKHKNLGSDRLAKRARKTYSMFRKIILNEQDYELIRECRPRVVLSLDASISPSHTLLSSLDYKNTDDQLVGCIYAYSARNTDLDVRLLTHDIGPMMTAKSIRLPFVAVPDGWLLPPEPNTTEKELAKLRRDIERLNETEPCFRTRFVDDAKNEIDEIVVEHIIYAPLVEEELGALIDSLTAQFPVVTDFGHRGPIEKFGLLGKEVYAPAKDEAILNYTTKEYPSWIERCKSVFSNLHNMLQRQEGPVFRFGATNEGIRPGKNVLVIISSRGDVKIRPPQMEGEYSVANGEMNLQLAEPPAAPQGNWESVWGSLHAFGKEPHSALSLHDRLSTPDMLLGSADRTRDPDEFYFKPGRPIEFVESFALECEQWRHGLGEEFFDGEMHVNGDRDEIAGALECEIHAENLSTPNKSIIPVRITVRRVSVRDYAFELVDALAVGTHEST